MMTGVVNSKELREQFADFRCPLLREVLVDCPHDEFAEVAVQCFAQEAEQIRRRDENNPFELCVDAPVLEAPGYFASEFGSLLITCRVCISKGMAVGGTAGSIARQIALVRAGFRVDEIFEFLQRAPGCCNGEDART